MANLWQNNLDVAAFLNGSLIIVISYLSLMISRLQRSQKWWVWLVLASILLGCASWFDISLLSSSNVAAPPWVSFIIKFIGCVCLSVFADALLKSSGGSQKYLSYAVLAASALIIYSINGGVAVASSVLFLSLLVPTCLVICVAVWRYLQTDPSVHPASSWVFIIASILLAGSNILLPLRTLSPYIIFTERIEITVLAWSSLIHLLTLVLCICGLLLQLRFLSSTPANRGYFSRVMVTTCVAVVATGAFGLYAYTSGIDAINRAYESVLQSSNRLANQLQTTKSLEHRAAGSVRYGMMFNTIINTPALQSLRLVHGAAVKGEYDQIIAVDSPTLNLGWPSQFKHVFILNKLDDPKNAVLTAESSHLFIVRKPFLLRVPLFMSGIILTSLWLLIGTIVAGSKLLADEQQLTASNIGMQQLRINKIFHCSQIGMAVLSLNGDVVEVNDATCRFLGRSSSELEGMNLNLLVWRDDYPDIQTELTQLSGTGKDHYAAEVRFARPDSRQVWALVNLMYEPGESGEQAHIIMQLQDITSRKQDEDQLRHSWEMLQVLLNAPDYGVFLLNPDGTTLLCNENAARRCGLSMDKMVGVRPLDELSPENKEFRINQLERVVKNAIPIRFEDATEKHTTTVAMWPVCDENGTVSTVALFLQDTTEMHHNKLELARVTQQAADLKTILDRSNVMVMRSTVHDKKVVNIFVGGNLDMLGYPIEFYYAPNFRWDSIIADTDNDRVQEEFWRKYHAGEQEFVLEARLCDVKGKEQWYTLTANVSHDQLGNKTGYELVVSNVNSLRVAEYETRSMEQRMIQAQKYESLAVLAGGIAHDLNNNLMTIIGNAELLLDGISADVNASLQDTLSAAQRAAKLSEQMLAFSGRGIFHLTPCHFNTLLADTIDSIRTQLPPKVKLHQHLNGDILQVLADHSQMSQVITNLCMNAVEAMTTGEGNLCISTEERYLTGNEQFGAHTGAIKPGRYVALIVKDDGHGMDASMTERMFEPFFSTKLPGRGLGLAAVLGIVRAHGGIVQVESLPGVGTTVTVYIPIRHNSEPDITPSKQQGSSKSNLILMVDDEPAVLDVGRQMLIHLGYEVVTAANGSEALVAFAELEGRVDCILLDLTMPIMDGGQTLRALRLVNETVPVVFVSGYDYSSVFDKINGLNYQGFLQKPYRISQIRQLLKSL
ncbi:MAG: PAS domain-containing hybrid sensor histidine kinase/response regulator [Armatimonadota bacterium]